MTYVIMALTINLLIKDFTQRDYVLSGKSIKEAET
jgi:hypothetical protein